MYHVTAPLPQTSLVQVVAYAFSWFTKFPDFMILRVTTKIGIQQIKLSIHMIREILQNFNYCILHIYKFVTCIFDHFIITSSEERERGIVFNATFNNISVISLQSVLLMEKAGVPGEIHRSFASHWQTYYYFNYIVAVSFSWWWKQEKTTDLSHNVASSSLCLSGIQTHNVR